MQPAPHWYARETTPADPGPRPYAALLPAAAFAVFTFRGLPTFPFSCSGVKTRRGTGGMSLEYPHWMQSSYAP